MLFPAVSPGSLDLGLLVLRVSGVFLALTFGWQKVSAYVLAIHAGNSLTSAGLTPLIKMMGFPAPAVLSVLVMLLESLGALLIATGLFTRTVAACSMVSMAGAFYVSLQLHEESLRALLYLVIFAGLVLTGPGKYSLDFVLRRMRANRPARP